MSRSGLVVWFTGLSGAGKSTLARAFAEQLQRQGKSVFVLDADELRRGLCRDLGYRLEDRAENIRRAAEVAKLMSEAGLIVLAAFITPLESDRQTLRQILGRERLREVHVDAPLSVCEARDPKGLYAKARRGEIPLFTGIDSPYEFPREPDLRLATSEKTLEECLKLLGALI